jgi:hypothetical protein
LQLAATAELILHCMLVFLQKQHAEEVARMLARIRDSKGSPLLPLARADAWGELPSEDDTSGVIAADASSDQQAMREGALTFQYTHRPCISPLKRPLPIHHCQALTQQLLARRMLAVAAARRQVHKTLKHVQGDLHPATLSHVQLSGVQVTCTVLQPLRRTTAALARNCAVLHAAAAGQHLPCTWPAPVGSDSQVFAPYLCFTAVSRMSQVVLLRSCLQLTAFAGLKQCRL